MADVPDERLVAGLRQVLGDLHEAEKFGLPSGTECKKDAVGHNAIDHSDRHGKRAYCLVCRKCWGCHMFWECPSAENLRSWGIPQCVERCQYMGEDGA